MKKIRTISLSLFIAMTFVACGDSDNPLKPIPKVEISSIDKVAVCKRTCRLCNGRDSFLYSIR